MEIENNTGKEIKELELLRQHIEAGDTTFAAIVAARIETLYKVKIVVDNKDETVVQ